MHEPTVPAIDKMHRIFLLLMRYDQGFTLTEVIKELELSKATAFRMLTHLAALGYLEYENSSSRYSLGPILISLGNHAKNRIDLKVTAHSFLIELANEVEETVKLSIYRDDTIFVLDSIESPKRMRIVVDQGAYFPPHIGAAGKLLLANQEQTVLEEYLNGTLESYTEYTYTDPVRLREVLTKIKEDNISFDHEEESLGIKAIASPVLDELGNVIGAVSIPYLAHVYDDKKEKELIDILSRYTATISSAIGYRGEKIDE